MPKFNEIEDLEPDFAPDLYSREEIDALIAEAGINQHYSRGLFTVHHVGNARVPFTRSY